MKTAFRKRTGGKQKKSGESAAHLHLFTWLGIGTAVLLIAALYFLLPGRRQADLNVWYGVTDGKAAVFLNTAQTEVNAVKENGNWYLPLSFVQESINERFYTDEETGGVLLSLPDQLVTFLPDEKYYLQDGEKADAEQAPLITIDGCWYLALDTAAAYTGMQYAAFDDPGRLWLWTAYDTDVNYAVSEKPVVLRTGKGIKKPVVSEEDAGMRFLVLETSGRWVRVLSENGQIGWTQSGKLTETAVTQVSGDWYSGPDYQTGYIPGNVSMGFDYIDDVSYGLDMLKLHLSDNAAVNVVAPTWFALQGSDGEFSSCADQAYVDLAHENGMQVWVMIENITGDCDTDALLSSRTARENLIENLIRAAKAYEIDGINLDFESLTEENVKDYTEFIRELSRACHENEIILSADTYAPYSWNAKYDLPELARILDYVIIMGYDESWETPGPNSDPDFITFCCEESLKYTDPDRLIIAVPFYARGWEQTEDGYIRNEIFMKKCEEMLESCSDREWLEDKGCWHGTVDHDGTQWEIWFETLESSEIRLRTIAQYNIKGIAEWRLAQEDTAVWDLVRQYILTE